MKHNLMLVSNDYELSKQIADEIADYFEVRVLDELELLAFDFAPTSIDELYENFGKDFILKKLSKIALSQCEFENVLFLSHFETLNHLDLLAQKVKENDLIIVLYSDTKSLESKSISSNIFSLKFEDDFLENIKQKFSDIFINLGEIPKSQIVNQIIEKIKDFYNLN